MESLSLWPDEGKPVTLRAIIPQKTCPTCGRSFPRDPRHPNTRYCSIQCSNRAQAGSGTILCATCGKLFRRECREQIYCSKACYGESRRKPGNAKIVRVSNCLVCGSPVHRTGTKYCSRDCAAHGRHYTTEQRTKICEYCGKPFEIKAYHWNAQHCSEACAHATLTYLPILTKTCLVCGTAFETKKAERAYCSSLCKYEHRRIKERERRANIPPRACPSCGTVFKPKKRANQKYCSRRCTMLDPAIRTMIDRNVSDVEREAHRILDEWGVPYEKQARVGFYFIDIYVARDNLAIEIAGCYWHACKKCGFDDPGRRKADARRTVFLRKHGYKVATVWEHDMKRDPYAALNDAFKGI